MWRVGHEQMVRETWEALDSGDFAAVEAVFAPDARWRAVEDGPWNCESRARIVQLKGCRDRAAAMGYAGAS
jgi:ketosteroid isomerase-like protein